MDHTPKKSKAFLVTFIAVIILLIVGYFIFKNSDQLFGTKSSTNITKTFSPLLGSSKPKDVTTTGGTTNPTGVGSNSSTGNNTPGSGSNTGGSLGTTGQITTGNGLGSGNFGSTGNLGASDGTGTDAGFGSVTPQFNPIPVPTNVIPPAPVIPPTITTPTVTPPANTNICPDDPLVFTNSEKTELEDLLRQYYLIAPGLKNDDDVALVKNDITTNQALIDQANTLSNQCQVQKTSPGYTGPQIVKTNPYYGGSVDTSGISYIPEFSQLEQLFNIW